MIIQKAIGNFLNLSTPIDTVVIGRLSNPWARFCDTTLEGYPQPITAFKHRICADRGPLMDQVEAYNYLPELSFIRSYPEPGFGCHYTREEIEKNVKDYDPKNTLKVLSEYNSFTKVNASCNIGEDSYYGPGEVIRRRLLENLIEDYNRATIFKFELVKGSSVEPNARIEDLDVQIDRLEFVYKKVKNLLRLEIQRNQSSKAVFEFGRNLYLEWFQGNDYSGRMCERYTMNTRGNWEFLSYPQDLSLAIWMLFSDMMPEINEETIGHVVPSDFDCLMKASEVDMCYEAIRQALVVYFQKDPTPRESSQSMIID